MAAFAQNRAEAEHEGRAEADVATPRAKSSDPTQRVTVPLPRTLNELQYAARRHFGTAVLGRHSYHHYGRPVMQDRHIDDFKHDDIVIISGEEMERYQQDVMTTHQADYVRPKLDLRKPFKHQSIPIEYQKFDHKSCYRQDYPKHQARPAESAKPVKSAWYRGNDVGTGQTTYKTQYTWHTGAPSRPIKNDAFGRELQPPASFEGISTNRADYVKHPVRPRSAAAVPHRDGNVPLYGDFDGETTYNQDYKRHPLVARGNAGGTAHKSSLEASDAPFNGASEYHRQYIPLGADKRQHIHLEPEVKVPKARPGSAPAGSRRLRAT